MGDAEHGAGEKQQVQPRIQIYPTSSSGVAPFWKEKYERDAKKYWDIFYKRHQDRFFKDRHYLDKEWGQYFSGVGKKVILEVGCGVGNTIFPLVAMYPDVFVYACDFSLRAVNLVKAHKEFTEDKVSAFVCDLTVDDLEKQICPSSVDVVTMIFVLSAVSPEKMPLVLQNIRKILKPNGHVLFRDYAVGDLAQERLISKDQKISENFYVRGDGTRAFYFSDEFLTRLFNENGFEVKEFGLCLKQVENRSREIVMNRRWVQAVFSNVNDVNVPNTESAVKVDPPGEENLETGKNDTISKEHVSNNYEVDMSEAFAIEMFGLSSSTNEIIEVNLKDSIFKINVLPKEYQHTCKSTGLMLWESARFMASILAQNPSIVSGKRVLELGSGCGGICSMVSSKSGDLVIATDGDSKALDMLTQNVALNLTSPIIDKLSIQRLEWGNKDHIQTIKDLNDDRGFDVIIGTDVTYVPEAILPLFATAKELISQNTNLHHELFKPALILCHVFRRVDEPSILSAASHHGFKLVDKWPSSEIFTSSDQAIISSWFSEGDFEDFSKTPLTIMYFQVE